MLLLCASRGHAVTSVLSLMPSVWLKLPQKIPSLPSLFTYSAKMHVFGTMTAHTWSRSSFIASFLSETVLEVRILLSWLLPHNCRPLSVHQLQKQCAPSRTACLQHSAGYCKHPLHLCFLSHKTASTAKPGYVQKKKDKTNKKNGGSRQCLLFFFFSVLLFNHQHNKLMK